MSDPNTVVCASFACGKCNSNSRFIPVIKHVCPKCKLPVHAPCGRQDEDAPIRDITTCFTCLESSASVRSGVPGARDLKRSAPPRKVPNRWLREQFTADESKPEKVTFTCDHCNRIAGTSSKGLFNATKMSEHIRMKCPTASDEVINKAFDSTQKNKKSKSVAATISTSNGKQSLLLVHFV